MSFKISVSRILKTELVSLIYPTGQVGPLIQNIRWIKPRFRPVAKSKQFYVRKPKTVNLEEDEKMKSLNNHYATKIRALRTFFLDEMKDRPKAVKTNYHEDFKELLLENDKWNAAIAKEREVDMAMLAEREAEKRKLQEEKYQQYKLEKMIAAEKKFHAEIEKPFISLEDLDKHIEQALDSKVTYNFAINKQGNIFKEEEQKLLGEEEEIEEKENSNNKESNS
ncbi:probable 28S ribosomal protein S26, mitochondrial [Argonauta hians]